MSVVRTLLRATRRAGLGSTSSFSSKTGGTSSAAGQGESSAVRDKLFQHIDMGVPSGATAAAASAAESSFSTAAEAGASNGATASTTAAKVVSYISNSLLYVTLAGGAALGYTQWAYDTAELQTIVERDEKEETENTPAVRKIWNVLARYYIDQRVYIETEMKKYADPPSDNLLPDLPPQAAHIKTLVLDLDNVLIHSDWTRGRGWRTFKRPGADDFIADLAQYFELVVYTSQLPTYADPILDRLDPHRMIQYRLYRDSTNYVNGKHVRDLSKLNRNLNQVLLITADEDAWSLQPENAIKLKKWKTSDKQDTTLLDIMPFLEAIVRSNVPDVRSVVKSYEGEEDIAKAFKERMRKVAPKAHGGEGKTRGFGGFGSRR